MLNRLQIAGVVPSMPVYFRKQEREAVDVDGAKRVIVKRLLYAVQAQVLRSSYVWHDVPVFKRVAVTAGTARYLAKL